MVTIMKKSSRKLPRCYRVSVMLNESEKKALDKYCKRYKITNRSLLIRQTMMKTILKKFVDDSPTLFDFNEL